jgi:alpha-glucosidase
MPWDEGREAGFTEGRPWLPIRPSHRRLSAAAQERDPDSVLAFYRAMIGWRRATPALRRGDIDFHDAPDPVLAFTRRPPEGAPLTCVFNLSPEPRGVAVGAARFAEGAPAQAAHVADGALLLGGNGFAFLWGDSGAEPALG